MQSRPREFYATVIFEQRDGDHFYIHSPDVPGLHLAGRSFDELHKLLPTAIKDLYWHNSEIVIDSIRWLPNLADFSRNGGIEPPKGGQERRVYAVKVKHAA